MTPEQLQQIARTPKVEDVLPLVNEVHELRKHIEAHMHVELNQQKENERLRETLEQIAKLKLEEEDLHRQHLAALIARAALEGK